MILKYDHYRPGQRKRAARAVLIPLLSVVVVLLRCRLLRLPRAGAHLRRPATPASAPGKLPDLFRAEKYDEVIAAADADPQGRSAERRGPLLQGFASFYRAVSQNAAEERMPYPRPGHRFAARARLAGTPFAGRSDYVLGKAYFNKGKYYYDLAISSMESSLARGYVQKDSYEYIGQAYTQLGDYQKALDNFLTALKDDPGDLLLLTIGQTYYQMKRTSDAVDYLLRTLNKTEDKDIEERARFLLGGIYLDTDELFKAEEQFAAIVEDRSRVGRRALRPRGGVCEDERPGEGARGVAQCADHRPVALRSEAPLLRRRNDNAPNPRSTAEAIPRRDRGERKEGIPNGLGQDV